MQDFQMIRILINMLRWPRKIMHYLKMVIRYSQHKCGHTMLHFWIGSIRAPRMYGPKDCMTSIRSLNTMACGLT